MPELNGTETHGNLKAAFAGESQANRRYLYFAKIADVYMETMCKVNSTTKRPNLVDKCLLLEFSRVDHKADIGTTLPRRNQMMTDKEVFLTIRSAAVQVYGIQMELCRSSSRI